MKVVFGGERQEVEGNGYKCVNAACRVIGQAALGGGRLKPFLLETRTSVHVLV